jgi:hypothetical protein
VNQGRQTLLLIASDPANVAAYAHLWESIGHAWPGLGLDPMALEPLGVVLIGVGPC